MDPTRREPVEPRLGLWDAVSIIVGIIIGVGIFENPTSIFAKVPGPEWAFLIWGLGGLLALLGAFCFAELASTYPRSGGEYVYLTRAYGPLIGYLFAWAQLAIIRPGSIGALAYVVAEYGAKLWDLNSMQTFLFAILSVVSLTAINILGVTLGKNTQNFLTLAKVLGLGAIVVVGFGWGNAMRHSHFLSLTAASSAGLGASAIDQGLWLPSAAPLLATFGQVGWFANGMILALWAYSGWNEAAYIVAEVKNGRRNIPLALIVGTMAVTAIYLIVNAAFLFALGFQRARGDAVPATVLSLAAGEQGANAISILIIISALGAINGMIFTTARIFSEFGSDHRLFEPLSRWSRRWGTPVRALVTETIMSVVLLFGVSVWVSLQGTLDIKDGFEKMIDVTAAPFWLFFLLTGISLFVLRAKDPDLVRPFRVPGYPLVPLVFCLCCACMVFGAIKYNPLESLIGLGIILLGVIFYFLPRKIKRLRVPDPEPKVPVGAL
jgi:APA family basic amino acid/polyamine antiporter